MARRAALVAERRGRVHAVHTANQRSSMEAERKEDHARHGAYGHADDMMLLLRSTLYTTSIASQKERSS